jgi:hypothetical protein
MNNPLKWVFVVQIPNETCFGEAANALWEFFTMGIKGTVNYEALMAIIFLFCLFLTGCQYTIISKK